MSETDVFVLLEGKGNAFEPVFAEYGHTCRQIDPRALGSPFCPPFRMLIVPSAFTAPQFYTGIAPALDRCASQIRISANFTSCKRSSFTTQGPAIRKRPGKR